MSSKFGKILVLLTLLGHLSLSLTADTYDLLSGQGLFNTQTLGSFAAHTNHTASFLVVNSSNVLKLQKPAASSVAFDSGLEYSFATSQPVHISFQFSSTSPDIEDANLRLIDSTTGHTVLLFRAGKAGFIRVNQNQMIQFYNSSVSHSDSDVKTIKMDILLNWTTSTIEAFVNEQWKGSATFFQNAASADKLRLYNLYQSTSYWKNLVVCTQNCYSFKRGVHLGGGVVLSLLLIMMMIVWR